MSEMIERRKRTLTDEDVLAIIAAFKDHACRFEGITLEDMYLMRDFCKKASGAFDHYGKILGGIIITIILTVVTISLTLGVKNNLIGK